MPVVALVTGDTVGLDILEAVAAVTLLAGHEGVKAQERKTREPMVEAHLSYPAAFVVTDPAFSALLTLVHIVIRVARQATSVEPVLTRDALVTPIAEQLGVRPAQGKVGARIVIEARLLPGRGAVTRLASGAVSTPVLVVLSVTSDTV